MSSRIDARQAILRAASGLFARQGFRKTSMDEIAKLAHVGKGTIYEVFESKEEVFATIIRDESEALLGGLSRAMSGETEPEAKVMAFVMGRVTGLRNMANLHQVTDDALLELIPLADEARRIYFEKELALLSHALDQGKRQGNFELDESRLVALAMLSALKGLETVLLRVSEPPGLEQGVQVAMNVFLRGLKR
jgi:AcrR family transcriptional regulator